MKYSARFFLLTILIPAVFLLTSCGEEQPSSIKIKELLPTSYIGTIAYDEDFGYSSLTINNGTFEITFYLIEGYGYLEKKAETFLENSCYALNMRIKNLSDKLITFESGSVKIETTASDIKSESRMIDSKYISSYLEKLSERAPDIGIPVFATYGKDSFLQDLVAYLNKVATENNKKSKIENIIKIKEIVNRWSMPEKLEIAPNETRAGILFFTPVLERPFQLMINIDGEIIKILYEQIKT